MRRFTLSPGPWWPLMLGLLLGLAIVALPDAAWAQDDLIPVAPDPAAAPEQIDDIPADSGGGPAVDIHVTSGDGNYAGALKVALLMLALTLIPALLVSVTSFARIVIVLGFLRQALGTQQLPPNQVLIGLSLFLCLFTMGPTLQKIYDVAVVPHEAGELSDRQAFEAGIEPIRDFMAHHTRTEDLKLFVSMTHDEKPESIDDVSTLTLVPAFMLSELRTAFIMGALIFIPFIIIDIVVASVLMSMGMMMVPPVMVSLPLKILLFVLADGWSLVVGSLARSIMGYG